MAKKMVVTVTGTYDVDLADYVDENGKSADPVEYDLAAKEDYGYQELLDWCDDDSIKVELKLIDDEKDQETSLEKTV
jgi:hypothetical protein